jgi:hypothetical protein
MKTRQAWGWLAAGVLAAGLNASYHDGGLQWAHRVADRVENSSAEAVTLASGRVDQFLAEAQVLRARHETTSCRVATMLARVQTMIARSQTGLELMSAREEAQRAKSEANRARMEARIAVQTAHFRIATASFAPVELQAMPAPVVCPRVRVNIPKLPMMNMPLAPEIHIEVAGAGPV